MGFQVIYRVRTYDSFNILYYIVYIVWPILYGPYRVFKLIWGLKWVYMKAFLDNFTDTTNLKSRNGQERIQSTLTVKSIKDNILQQYSCTAKNRAASVTKKADIFIKGI